MQIDVHCCDLFLNDTNNVERNKLRLNKVFAFKELILHDRVLIDITSCLLH